MNVLLDTHVIIWLLRDDPQLKPHAREVIQNASGIAISEVSLWELSIKRSLGKLPQIPEMNDTLVKLGFQRLHIADLHLKTYETTPITHKDPFDRMLMSQAIAEGYALVTADQKILETTIPGLNFVDARR